MTILLRRIAVQGDKGINRIRQLLQISKGIVKFPGETSGNFRISAVKNMFVPLQDLSLSLNSPLKYIFTTVYSP